MKTRNLNSTLIILLVACSTLSLSGQKPSEEAIIQKVIEDETKFFYARDYENWSNLWIHEPYAHFSYAGPNGAMESKGWEEMNNNVKNDMEKNSDPINWSPKKTDYSFKISDKMAFVTFLEDGNSSTRVLEKVKGDWKLVSVGVVVTTAYKNEAKQQKLKSFDGEWKVDKSTVKILNPDDNELKKLKAKIAYSEKGLFFNLNYDLHHKDGGEWSFWQNIRFAYDYTTEKMVAVCFEGGDNWSNVFNGDCEMLDNGNMNIKMYHFGTRNKVKWDESITWKSKDSFERKITVYNNEGNIENEYSYLLVRI